MEGRTVEQAGAPLRISEMLATIDGAVYVERVSLHSPAEVRKAKKAIRTAFEVQEKKLGFAFVEFLSTCPTNWGLSPVAALDFIKDKMIAILSGKKFQVCGGGKVTWQQRECCWQDLEDKVCC